MRLSVIIPTRNRKDSLTRCIRALEKQSYDQRQYEVIVVDDGSRDGTIQMLATLKKETPFSLRYLEQTPRGPAAARNLGIRNSRGEIILITGDDILACPRLLQEHLEWHDRYPGSNEAVLGFVTWSPELPVTLFMRWLEESGTQFGYPFISGETPDFWFFYSSNISLKREFLLAGGLFDEQFPYAAYEDIELGYRLTGKGLRIHYNKNASAFHYHSGVNPQRYTERMRKAGESAAILCRKHPQLHPLISKAWSRMRLQRKRLRLWTVFHEALQHQRWLPVLESLRLRSYQYYERRLAEAFWEGFTLKDRGLEEGK